MSAEKRAWLQLGLALVGFGAVAGSVMGACFGYVRTAACWCCDPEAQEPL